LIAGDGSGEVELNEGFPVPSPRGGGRGLGRGDGTERKKDRVEDGDRLAEDEVGRETEHADTAAKKECRSPLVVVLRFRGEVLTAVELDGQMSFRTVEVQDVRAAGMLPSKLKAGESGNSSEDRAADLGAGPRRRGRIHGGKGQVSLRAIKAARSSSGVLRRFLPANWTAPTVEEMDAGIARQIAERQGSR
jgi:hypothetical protein